MEEKKVVLVDLQNQSVSFAVTRDGMIDGYQKKGRVFTTPLGRSFLECDFAYREEPLRAVAEAAHLIVALARPASGKSHRHRA